MHLGLDAHVAGGVTTPPIGPGDALVVSILPMGTAYEIAMLIFLDLVAVEPRERTRQTMARLRARQYNLG